MSKKCIDSKEVTRITHSTLKKLEGVSSQRIFKITITKHTMGSGKRERGVFSGRMKKYITG